MDEILKQIGEWLLEAEGDLVDSIYATEEDFHKGEVSALKKVGVLVQCHLTNQSSDSEDAKQPCNHDWQHFPCKPAGFTKCIKCGLRR